MSLETLAEYECTNQQKIDLEMINNRLEIISKDTFSEKETGT